MPWHQMASPCCAARWGTGAWWRQQQLAAGCCCWTLGPSGRWVGVCCARLHPSAVHEFQTHKPTHTAPATQVSAATLAHIGGFAAIEASSSDLVATAGYSKRLGQLVPDNAVKVSPRGLESFSLSATRHTRPRVCLSAHAPHTATNARATHHTTPGQFKQQTPIQTRQFKQQFKQQTGL